MEFKEVNAEAHTVAVLTLVLPPTLVTTATATMQTIGREDQWCAGISYQIKILLESGSGTMHILFRIV